ncbi:MAG TPA: class I SAM-dependent methyltransferase [Candidatus Binataceae bacterium]|nr:class I SAM-dependent methyltransferase [Candidatus Binataceae bacterium]
MDEHDDRRSISEHDWHSRQYVDDWIQRFAIEDEERRGQLREALSSIPFSIDGELRVLDVGSGYGLFADEVLKRFPRARVTLLDYSVPMFEQVRRRLAAYRERLDERVGDLSDSAWAQAIGQNFDLAVSALVIHNLRKESLMANAYRAIRSVLRPGGAFLDYDLLGFTGGIGVHTEWLHKAGFSRIECLFDSPPAAILAAFV